MTRTNTEIIAVGTELLLGQIANTNGQWISKELVSYGMNVFYHTVVGDNLERVERVFREAHSRSDIVIVSGGLGPTTDDMTREAFQHLSKLKMTIHEPSLANIQSFFQKRNIKMTPNNERQARIFENANVLMNKVGMAPGMIVTYEKTIWIFLPGVPKEMKAMMKTDVLPYLNRVADEHMVISSEMLNFIGIGESALEDQLRDLIDNQTNPTIAPLAKDNGVGIRLTAKAENKEEATTAIERIKSIILERVDAFYAGSNLSGLTEIIFHLLKRSEKDIAAAESLTGGLFADEFISLPGASSVFQGGLVCYNTKVKTDILHVSPETVKEHGVVSEECAMEMALNIRDIMDVSIGMSFTGVAGPDRLENKPAGMVFIGVADVTGKKSVEGFQFYGDRESIRRQAVAKGNDMLYKFLTE